MYVKGELLLCVKTQVRKLKPFLKGARMRYKKKRSKKEKFFISLTPCVFSGFLIIFCTTRHASHESERKEKHQTRKTWWHKNLNEFTTTPPRDLLLSLKPAPFPVVCYTVGKRRIGNSNENNIKLWWKYITSDRNIWWCLNQKWMKYAFALFFRRQPEKWISARTKGTFVCFFFFFCIQYVLLPLL